jgi:pyrroloquinoline quinone (PQQ) biosynthesis protein C
MAGKFLATFDSLVKSFPGLIAAGAARMEDEESRATLAVNLYQECGEGDATRSHHAIYRKFLATAGIQVSAIEEQAFTAEWREKLTEYIQVSEPQAVLGALAAGEFLAQPVLTKTFSVIQPLYPNADTEYFTYHLQLEENHVQEITETIVKSVGNSGGFEEIVAGFKFGLSVWENYFGHLTEFIAEKQYSR